MRRIVLLLVPLLAPLAVAGTADAHGGGLDSNGGHHCRQAGFDSGKCSPLNSYHSHGGGEADPPPPPPAPRATAPPPPPPPPPTTAPPPPPPPPTTTTTAAPTTTTTRPTTTTTTTERETTTTAAELEPASAEEPEPGFSDGVLSTLLLGGAGYGGVKLYRRYRT